MGLSNIQEKLQIALQKDSFEESDVVYILSRIRKIIEIEKKEAKYAKLKFYCNWALHSKIDDIEPFRSDLEEFLALDVKKLDGMLFLDFRGQLTDFLNEFGLSTVIFSSQKTTNNFFESLISVYEDTPLVIKVVKRKVQFKKQSVDEKGVIIKYEIIEGP